jgi:hypothetical protein
MTTIEKRISRLKRLAEYARQDKNILKCYQAYRLIGELQNKAAELSNFKIL